MRARDIKKILLFMIMLVITFICVFPFYSMIMMSTHVTEDIYKGVPLLPGNYLIENIKTVFGAHFEMYYKNSIIQAVCCTALSLTVSTMTGYALAMFRFKGSKLMFTFILVTMAIPTQLGLVAFITEMKAIGWMNTLLPLIIPPAASGFGVYWMKNFISGSLPPEILDSGRIDGASEPGILLRIVVPIIKPAIASMGLMQFVSNWNSFLVPLIVLNRNETYTVPIGIINLNSAYRNDLAAKITALAIGTVPLLILYLSASKTFIQGISAGSVKG